MLHKKIYLSACLSSALLLTACASQPTSSLVIQNINNEYEVTGLGKTQVSAKNNAIQAANQGCGKNAVPILIKEETHYQGPLKDVVDEKTGKMIQAAANVLGGVLGSGLGSSSQEDYLTVLTFKCRTQ